MLVDSLSGTWRTMSQQVEKEAQRLLRSIAVPLRATTWKCGRVERLLVNYLRTQLQWRGRNELTVRDVMQHFNLKGRRKNEFLDALKRLEKRRIIRIVAV